MKPLSTKLKNRIKKEKASPELMRALLNEIDPNDLCINKYYLGEDRSNPDQCCILGTVNLIRTGMANHPTKDNPEDDFRYLTRHLYGAGQSTDLASVNNGNHDDYPQATVYERLDAFTRELEIYEQLKELAGIKD